mmetsp:Transcript_4859/g.6150  ORF Transcript_4859/g.6150 Transcript_4859/m.6150 type:complete len:145 (+) Transcript_4859:103-537(+)
MMSYFKFFVTVLFPIPAILLTLLLLPLPTSIHVGVIRLADSILFLKPHPNLELSLFWLCFGLSCFTLFSAYQSYDNNKEVYYNVKNHGGHQPHALVKLMAAERNVWISTLGCALWLILHRYRSLMKRCFRAESLLENEVEKKIK